jgi:tetraacyldisaccharide 4'-kinase
MYLFQLVVWIRNWLFDIGILPSKKFDIPVISVGNITVGGTGKTPHTEYLLELLSPETKVAMLSRGYKRTSKGFVLADDNADASTIGDEPFQIFRKFKNKALVAVDANRRRGIENILNSPLGNDVGAIVLDDAYQHRFVEPGINILLTDYNRIITHDKMMPVGSLREPAENRKRAHIVIVTKCPDSAQPIDYRLTTKHLNLFPYQNLYFTKYSYEDLTPVFPESVEVKIDKEKLNKEKYDILVVTGIVSQHYLIDYLKKYTKKVHNIEFADHHVYSDEDIQFISNKFSAIENPKKIIITTEKDASRLISHPSLSDDIKASLYALPIKVSFLFDQEKNFNEQILGYVRKNKTNRGLFKK